MFFYVPKKHKHFQFSLFFFFTILSSNGITTHYCLIHRTVRAYSRARRDTFYFPNLICVSLVNDGDEDDDNDSVLMPSMEELPEDAASLTLKRENSLHGTLRHRLVIHSASGSVISLFPLAHSFSLGAFPE